MQGLEDVYASFGLKMLRHSPFFSEVGDYVGEISLAECIDLLMQLAASWGCISQDYSEKIQGFDKIKVKGSGAFMLTENFAVYKVNTDAGRREVKLRLNSVEVIAPDGIQTRVEARNAEPVVGASEEPSDPV